VAGDGLDELDIGAGGYEPRDASVSQVVEPVAKLHETRVLDRWAPDAPVEVRFVERRPARRRKDELIRCVTATLKRSPCEVTQSVVNRGEQRDRANTSLALPPLEFTPSLGEIANGLTANGVPTAHGGRRWWPSTVRAVALRAQPEPKPRDLTSSGMSAERSGG
jgi:hypothetical protein